MKKSNEVFVGCDLGDKRSEYCVLNRRGEIVETGHVRTTTSAITKRFRTLPRARVVVEVGTHSRWVAELLKGLGHEVIVANARQVQLIWKRRYKTDQTDAELLARLGRVDASLLSPVQHRSRAAHIDLACIKSRDALVRMRTKLVNSCAERSSRSVTASRNAHRTGCPSSTGAFPRSSYPPSAP